MGRVIYLPNGQILDVTPKPTLEETHQVQAPSAIAALREVLSKTSDPKDMIQLPAYVLAAFVQEFNALELKLIEAAPIKKRPPGRPAGRGKK